MLSIVVKSP